MGPAWSQAVGPEAELETWQRVAQCCAKRCGRLTALGVCDGRSLVLPPAGPGEKHCRGRVEGVVSGGVAWPDKAVELLD